MVTDTGIIDTLNSLLRVELSAVACYRRVLDRQADKDCAALGKIAGAHEAAAGALREHIYCFGGRPTQDGDAWASFTGAAEGTMAFKCLRDGEEYTARSYADALQDMDLPAECKMIIRETLLPQTQAHGRVLEQLMTSSR
jgi:hypothetical protein